MVAEGEVGAVESGGKSIDSDLADPVTAVKAAVELCEEWGRVCCEKCLCIIESTARLAARRADCRAASSTSDCCARC